VRDGLDLDLEVEGQPRDTSTQVRAGTTGPGKNLPYTLLNTANWLMSVMYAVTFSTFSRPEPAFSSVRRRLLSVAFVSLARSPRVMPRPSMSTEA
jgi:hypothetical protein